MKRISILARVIAICGAFIAFASAAQAEIRLLMLDSVACPYCEQWTEEIGGIYPKTEEGRTAPLLRMDIRAELPEGVVLESPALFTPTFVLLVDGQEINRITGYPGEDFFWWMLENMIKKIPEQQAEAEGS